MTNLFGTAADDRGALCYFSYSVGGGMRRFSGFSYQVSRLDDGMIEILINEDFPDQKRIITSDETVFSDLQAIIDEHNMTAYKGRYEPRTQVLDADSWYFDLKYEYGFTVSASGVLRYPRGGAAAFKALKEYFAKWDEVPGEVDSMLSFDYTRDTGEEELIPVSGKMTRFRFDWQPDYLGRVYYYVNATKEPPTIYFKKGNMGDNSYPIPIGAEDLELLRHFVASMKVDNTYEDSTPAEGTGNWYLTINFDSGDIIGINGRISDPRTEEEMRICEPIHDFFKPIIAKLEEQMEDMETIHKEEVSQNDGKTDSGRKEEQSLKSAPRKWWQFWK
jgi:hypothetical protein